MNEWMNEWMNETYILLSLETFLNENSNGYIVFGHDKIQMELNCAWTYRIKILSRYNIPN